MSLTPPPPISGFPLPHSLTNVTPFTYRDGETFLRMFERLRKWLNTEIIPEINRILKEQNDFVEDEIAELVSTINTTLAAQTEYVIQEVTASREYTDSEIAEMRTYVDEQVALIINDSIQVQDPVVAGIMGNAASQTRVATDALYYSKTQGEANNTAIDAIQIELPLKAKKRPYEVDVKDFGAVPEDQNGGEGATDAFNAAVDAVAAAGGGIVWVDDDYWIKAHDPDAPAGNFLGDYGGVGLKDNVTLMGTGSGILRVIPNNEHRYVAVRIFDKVNVAVKNLHIIGDRAAHTGATGEWGYGIAITGGENITIENVTISAMWGDGFNIQRFVPSGGGPVEVPKRVRISNVLSDGNRRQGMSIEAGNNILVEDSIFQNTGGVGGTAPMNGIDIEPVDNATLCTNIQILRCDFNNNVQGLTVYMDGTSDVLVDDCNFNSNTAPSQVIVYSRGKNVTIRGSRFTGTVTQCILSQGGDGRRYIGNEFDAPVYLSYDGITGMVAKHVRVADNRFITDRAVATQALIRVNEHARFVEIIDNYIENKQVRINGIHVLMGGGSGTLADILIRGNTIVNTTYGIITGVVTNLTIIDNTINGTAAEGIRCTPNGGLINDNRISGANLISGAAAILFDPNVNDTLVADNKIELDPTITVAETRRGTHGIDFSFGPFQNSVVRSTHLKGVYTALGTRLPSPAANHVNSYVENLTPFTLVALP